MKAIALMACCPLLSGCVMLAVEDAICHIKRDVGEEYTAILKRNEYRFPFEIEYTLHGQHKVVRDTLVCKNPDIGYGFSCDDFDVLWDRSYQNKQLHAFFGRLKLLDLDAGSTLELETRSCDSLLDGSLPDETSDSQEDFYIQRIDPMPKEAVYDPLFAYDSTTLTQAQAKQQYGLEVLRYQVDKTELRDALGGLLRPPATR